MICAVWARRALPSTSAANSGLGSSLPESRPYSSMQSAWVLTALTIGLSVSATCLPISQMARRPGGAGSRAMCGAEESPSKEKGGREAAPSLKFGKEGRKATR